MHKLVVKKSVTEDEIHEVGAFRYRCFLNEGLIAPEPSQHLIDEYDFLRQTHVLTVWFRGQLAGTIRIHALDRRNHVSATMDAFPDILIPKIEAGLSLIDGARFAVDPELGPLRLLVARQTLRLYSIIAESQFFDFGVAAVRPERVEFFQRIYNFSPMSEPRSYSRLTKDLVLLGVKLRHLKGSKAGLRGHKLLEQVLNAGLR